MKRIDIKVLSLLLALLLAVGVMAPAAPAFAAAKASEGNEKEDFVYVSLGDSMSNGYCFTGYDQGSSHTGFLTGDGGYGETAYPNLIEQWLSETYNVTHYQLAVSAQRPEDLLFYLGVLEEQYQDDWENQVANYAGLDNDGNRLKYNKEALIAYYQEAVESADLITMSMGNASFGAYLLNRTVDALGVFGAELDDDQRVDLSDSLGMLDKSQQDVILQVYDIVMEQMLSYLDEGWEEKLSDYADIVAYTVANHMLCYTASIDRIVELNPDVEIVIIGMMNPAAGLTVSFGDTVIPVGDIFGQIFDVLNAYIAGYATVKQLTGEYSQATLYYTEIDNIEFIGQVFGELKDGGWVVEDSTGLDGQKLRERNIDSYNDMICALFESLFQSLVKASLQSQYGENWEMAYYQAYGEEGFHFDELTAEIVNAFDIDAVDSDQLFADPETLNVICYLAFEDAVVECGDVTDIPVSGLLKIVSGGWDSLLSAQGYDSDWLSSAAALREGMTSILTSTDEMRGLVKLYVLFKLGNGASVHPTPATHEELAQLIIDAYESNYTVVDETVENILQVLEALGGSAEEYRDELYLFINDEALLERIQEAIDKAQLALEQLKQEQIDKAQEFQAVLKEYLLSALSVEYAPTEESYYVAVTGTNDGYAGILAELLGVDYATVNWAELDMEILAKADLISVGYESSDLYSYATECMLGFAADYIREERVKVNDYLWEVLDVFVTDPAKYMAIADAYIDEYIGMLQLDDRKTVELDWEALLGEDAVYVDQVRAMLYQAVASTEIPATYCYTIYVADILTELGVKVREDKLESLLGDNISYAIEIPVHELMAYGLEAYLYSVIQFNQQYATAVQTIIEVNPDAAILLLTSANPLQGLTVQLEGTTVDLSAAYSILAGATNVQLYLKALENENVAYVDISDVETTPVSEDMLTLALAYMQGAVGAVTDEGNGEISRRMYSALTSPEDEDNAADPGTPTDPDDPDDQDDPTDPSQPTPGDEPSEKEGLSTGAVVAIVVASVAVVGGAGACVYIFAIKKKVK